MNASLAGLVAVLLLVATALVDMPTQASQGVSIDIAGISVTDELEPGGEYELPAFAVRNPGSVATRYAPFVAPEGNRDDLVPALPWFTFNPPEFDLAPGESARIQTRVAIPPDAQPGAYSALLGAEIVESGAGQTVGGGAAARLTFVVGDGNTLEAWLRALWRILASNLWMILVLAAAGGLVVVRLLRRRFAVSVVRRV